MVFISNVSITFRFYVQDDYHDHSGNRYLKQKLAYIIGRLHISYQVAADGFAALPVSLCSFPQVVILAVKMTIESYPFRPPPCA